MTSPALMNTYGLRSTTLVSGEGCYLWDDQQRRYLDALSGIAVCGLGHSHPEVTAAIAEQAGKLLHCSNYFNIPKQEQLGEKLRALSGMSNMFFANSGAEANEAAIKLARLHGHRKGIAKPTVIVTNQSFHGRTMATLSATGNRKVHAGFEPLVSGFARAPYDDIAAIEEIAKNNNDVCAVMVEPIQGEGGIRVPNKEYLPRLRALCDQHDWLLICDEIQTGNARTGKFFAYQHSAILPDVVTTAKGLGNGMPIGVCMVARRADGLMQPGNHGSTFGGNPLACAAALATLNVIERDQLEQRAAQLGFYLASAFCERIGNHPAVKEIRAVGLMIGIELKHDCPDLFQKALDTGLVLNVTAGNTVRLLPPLIMSDAQADQVIETVIALIDEHHTATSAV